MKTKLLILALMLTIFSAAFAQEFNPKLLVKYSENELIKMKQISLDFYLTNEFRVTETMGYYFTDMPTKPGTDVKQLKKININTGAELPDVITDLDLIDFNPLNYNCVPNFDQYAFYEFGNTGKLLVLFSETRIQKLIEIEKLKNK